MPNESLTLTKTTFINKVKRIETKNIPMKQPGFIEVGRLAGILGIQERQLKSVIIEHLELTDWINTPQTSVVSIRIQSLLKIDQQLSFLVGEHQDITLSFYNSTLFLIVRKDFDTQKQPQQELKFEYRHRQ